MSVLVLEASTSSAKAMLYDKDTGYVEEESYPYPQKISCGGKQDTEGVFLAILEAGKKLAAGKDINAIAVGGVWHSIAICDKSMKPAAPTYTWEFTGASDICRNARDNEELAKRFYRKSGCMPNTAYQPYTLRYLADNGMNLKDKLLSSQAGYNFYRLTGERVETASIISGMGLLDTHMLTYNSDAMDFAGVDESQFGKLGSYKTICPLTKECADMLGIAPGIPVVAPHSDGALNQVGNGATEPGIMTLSVGTSAAIRVCTDAPVLSDPPGTWCYVGAEGWLCGAATAGACNCINWFKETALENKWSYQELESSLQDDSNALVFLPFLFGERCPGWRDERRGGFYKIEDGTTVPQMYQAICEGVLFNIYQCYEIIKNYVGKPKRIIMSGGILNSAGWSQMAADIFGCDITLSDTAQASMFGGAALALHASGELPGLADFSDTSTQIISPRNGATAVYIEKYERYLDCYEGDGSFDNKR